jgi:FkbM family methyltransferase
MNLISLIGRLGHSARSSGYAQPLYRVRAGIDRAARALAWPPLGTTTAEGVPMRGYLRHRGFMRHLASGSYESVTGSLLSRLLAPDVAFIDGGAHIGYYTLFAASRAGRVKAYEPDPYNLAALRHNVAHGLGAPARERVEVHARALSSEPGTAVFYVSDTTIGNSLAHRKDIGEVRTVQVRATTLDLELADLGHPRCVIKIDVEGAESRVLDGAREALARLPEVAIVSETHPSALAAAGSSPQALVRQLRDLGFDVCYLDEKTGAAVEADALILARKGNLLAVRGDSWGELRGAARARVPAVEGAWTP